MKKMSKLVSLALCGCMVLGLFAGCDSDKVTINVCNWGEYMSTSGAGDIDVIQKFEEKYPNIKVNYTTIPSNEELYAKIKSGGAAYDVAIPSDYMIGRLIDEGMLEKLDFANIPNFANVMDDFKGDKVEFDPTNEYSVPYAWGTVGIIYNSKMVDDPVDSWDILWNEKYKDQILMFNNSRDAFGIAEKKLGYSQNTTSEEELRACMEELKKQKPVVQSYVMDEIFNKMEGGSAALAPYYAGDAITMAENNPDLKFAIPKEGTNRFIDSMVVFKGTKHKKEAELFINFMCETEIGLANSEVTGYSTPLKNVYDALDDDVKNNKIAYPDQSVLEKCESFKNLPTETNKLMDELWMEIITDNN